jgi:hypothetical protein
MQQYCQLLLMRTAEVHFTLVQRATFQHSFLLRQWLESSSNSPAGFPLAACRRLISKQTYCLSVEQINEFWSNVDMSTHNRSFSFAVLHISSKIIVYVATCLPYL